jgi:hypothetical protein
VFAFVFSVPIETKTYSRAFPSFRQILDQARKFVLEIESLHKLHHIRYISLFKNLQYQQEWGFKDPRTAALMLKRQKRLQKTGKKKLTAAEKLTQ